MLSLAWNLLKSKALKASPGSCLAFNRDLSLEDCESLNMFWDFWFYRCVLDKQNHMLSMESREGLGKPYMMRTFAFGSALDTVGGGHDDPVGVAVGAFFLLLALAHLLPVHSQHHHLRLCSEWWRSSQLPRGRLEQVQSYKEVHRYSLQLCSPDCVMCSQCKCWIFDPFSVLNSLLWLISPAHVGWAHAWWPSSIQFSSMGLEDLKVFPGGTTCDIASLHLVGQLDPLIIGVMVSLILNLAFIGHWNSNLILNSILWGHWWQNVKVSEGLLTKDIAGLLILIS